MNQNSKSLGQTGGSMCGKELVKELQPLISHQSWNMEEALLWYGGGGLLSIAKLGICTRWRANLIRLQHHVIPSDLWLKDLYSCKIMTQSILVNSAIGTLKAKRDSISFNWCLGWHNHLVWDELDQKVKGKRSSPLVTLTGKLGRTIFSLSPVFGRKNLWSSDSGQGG